MIRLRLHKALLLLGVALTAVGCFKKVTTETTVAVKGYVQEQSNSALLPAEGMLLYAYYTGDDNWDILSYEDALNKVITNKTTGEQRMEPNAEGVPYTIEGSTNTYLSFYQNAAPAMVVVVYPAAKIYGYMFRNLEAENLPTTYLTIIFRPWKPEPYYEGSKAGHKWYVVPSPLPEEGGDAEEGTTDDNTTDGGTDDGGDNQNN